MTPTELKAKWFSALDAAVAASHKPGRPRVLTPREQQRKNTDNRDNQIAIAYVDSHLHPSDIAERFGISRDSVDGVLYRKIGPRRGKGLTIRRMATP